MEFDWEFNPSWWTFGVRRKLWSYEHIEWLVGVGPLLLVWRVPQR